MKVAKWKVLGVAGALVLGYAASSQAFQLKVDDDTFMNVNYRLQVVYLHKDQTDKTNGTGRYDYSRNYFDVWGSRVYFTGQINNLIQFYTDINAKKANGTYKVHDEYINFAFAPEFQLKIGKDAIPFTRRMLANTSWFIFPVADGVNDPQDVMDIVGRLQKGLDDTGLAELHGELGDGMLAYQVAIFDQGNRTDGQSFKGFDWAARVDFTPTMWGFAPARYKDTYLGKKDVMDFGVAYVHQKNVVNGTSSTYDSVDGWTVDFMVEKRFNNLVPSLEAAYISLQDCHYDLSSNDFKDSSEWYVQGQILYDQMVGIGKPALAFKYGYAEDDYSGDDKELAQWSIGLNYYIEDGAAKVFLGVNNYDYDGKAETDLNNNNNQKEASLTNYYLFAQIFF